MANELPMTTAQTALDLPALVRQRDYRRFLAIQLAAPTQRPILYALTAFADEMAQIPHHIREPLAGFMRYAWWREALEAMQEGLAPRAHPLLQELAPWLATHPQAYPALYELIVCGQRILEDTMIETPRESIIDGLWALALGGTENPPLKILRSLPFGQRIGPLRILHIIAKGLAS